MNVSFLRYLIGLLKGMLHGGKVIVSGKGCFCIKIPVDSINQCAYTPNQLSTNDTNCQGSYAIACYSIPCGTMRLNKINHLGYEKPNQNELSWQKDNKVVRVKDNRVTDQRHRQQNLPDK